MPPVATPNPDRARRGASVVSTGKAKAEVDADERAAGNLSESAILRLMV